MVLFFILHKQDVVSVHNQLRVKVMYAHTSYMEI